MVVSMLFFGLVLNVGNFGGDIYMNFFLFSLVEVVGYFILLLVLKCLGWKLVYVGFFLLGGVVCILMIFLVFYGDISKLKFYFNKEIFIMC